MLRSCCCERAGDLGRYALGFDDHDLTDGELEQAILFVFFGKVINCSMHPGGLGIIVRQNDSSGKEYGVNSIETGECAFVCVHIEMYEGQLLPVQNCSGVGEHAFDNGDVFISTHALESALFVSPEHALRETPFFFGDPWQAFEGVEAKKPGLGTFGRSNGHKACSTEHSDLDKRPAVVALAARDRVDHEKLVRTEEKHASFLFPNVPKESDCGRSALFLVVGNHCKLKARYKAHGEIAEPAAVGQSAFNFGAAAK